MAIIKDVLTPQGVIGQYHKIIKAEIRSDDVLNVRDVVIWVAIFASAEARDAGKDLMWVEYVTIPFSAFTQDPRDLLYPMLAYFGDSYLRGGAADAELPADPGNFSINLTEAALVPSPEPAPPVAAPVAPIFVPLPSADAPTPPPTDVSDSPVPTPTGGAST